MAETIKHRLGGRISVHDSVQEMYERIKEDGMSNTFDRFDPQEKIRCGFCSEGVSCQLCTNGPCRISDKADATLGVCGIDRNAMAMRDMLLRNAMGIATYSHHAWNAFKTLKETAEGKTPFKITDVDKLMSFAGQVGVDTSSGDPNKVAGYLADFLMFELHRAYDEPSKMIDVFAPAPRIKLWKETGLYPNGPLHEIKDAVASCLTNVDGSHVSMAKKALKLGISCIYGAQLGLEWTQDILFGTPSPHEVNTDLGILDPEYINIVFNGHEMWTGVATLMAARDPQVQQRAKDAGAKGLRVVGSIETGQELVQRFQMDDIFVGLTGNWLAIEPMLATGAVDVFAMDENCSPPNIAPYAEKYGITLVSVNDLVRIPGVEKNFNYVPAKVGETANKLIEYGIENFKNRKGKITAKVPKRVQKAIAGFSTEAVVNALGGNLNPLIDVIKAGKIKGAVALVNCTTLSTGPHDWMTTNLTKELIKKDILVLSGGCGNHALEVAGLCDLGAIEMAGSGLQEVCNMLKIPPVLSFGTCTDTGRISTVTTALANALGVDTSDLPVAVTAPQYLEQKATIDGMFALAYGLYTHLSPTPPVAGGPELVKLLTEDLPGITGGKVALGDDPVKVANDIEEYIMEKRKALGIG